MKVSRVPEMQWSQLSALIGESMGLNFPRERRDDLERGLAGAAQELGFDDISSCIDWLLSRPLEKAQLQVLASHLTIGETYFFRDEPSMAALAGHVLPELIQSRRARERRLRIWSAACCTGEEPYSLAILLHELLPDLRHWQITITATDINGRFLRKAAAGVYTEWSFRGTPAHLKQRYFNRTPDGRYAIIPEIAKLVSFEHLNLAEDIYPTLATDTNAMDLILCRNVLMYFTSSQMHRAVRNLHHALVDGGWLAVSPSEASQTVFAAFVTVNLPGVILYRKSDAKLRTEQSAVPVLLDGTAGSPAADIESAVRWTAPTPAAVIAEYPTAPLPQQPLSGGTPPALAVAQSLYEEGRYSEVVETLLPAISRREADVEAFSLLTRALANQGKLAEALTWCDCWIAADKLNAAAHYLRAIVLMEHGDTGEARASLQRATYLQPEFVLAHFALGNLARGGGHKAQAEKHFANALHLSSRYRPGDVLPESDGLTAGRLTETLTSMTSP